MVARWSRTLVVVLLIQLAVGASVARGDGLPVLGVVGSSHGVRSLDGLASYATRPAGSDTRVLRLTRRGRVIAGRRLRGTLVVPLVAYDGTSAGLSANGRTLVLIRPRVRFPQPRTELAILATRGLAERSRLRLRGDFSFDAVSPDGRWIYLIQYTSATDPTRYRVRALNAHTGRLLGRDIIDPHDRTETMRGAPVTRVSSSDGRWAYTLYDGAHPFVHALDTAGQKARCLDLPGKLDAWATRLRLGPTGRQLLVETHHRTAASIDTRTLVVSGPAPLVRPRPRSTHAEGGGLGALPLTCGVLALLSAVILIIRRRSGHPLQPVEAP